MKQMRIRDYDNYLRGDGIPMATRKQLQSNLVVNPELERLLIEARDKEVSEDDLKEQRVSFAFGNAPESKLITKESVRVTSQRIRLQS
jgi:hypothetical protein